jgi:hypothetical protein
VSLHPADQQFLDDWLREYHDPRPSIPDGRRCINCKVPARNGQITHTTTCPDYVRRRTPRRMAAAGPGGYRHAQADLREAYDRFVGLLVPGRRRDRYDCPSCGAPGDGHGLKVDLAGDRILFHCFACGGRDEILTALGLSWADLGRTGDDRPGTHSGDYTPRRNRDQVAGVAATASPGATHLTCPVAPVAPVADKRVRRAS